jgi:hypothetical protein
VKPHVRQKNDMAHAEAIWQREQKRTIASLHLRARESVALPDVCKR